MFIQVAESLLLASNPGESKSGCFILQWLVRGQDRPGMEMLSLTWRR